MPSNGWSLVQLLRIGCLCSKERIIINSREYIVKEMLGEGGFSTVYLVEDNMTGRLFAVKKIICHSLEDENYAMSEIKTHRAVQHENVVKLIDYCSFQANPPAKSCTYLLLPYLEKGTLLQELDRRGRSLRHFRPVEILEMFLRICDGVRAFHECDPPIAHRDLKTANILLDNSGCPLIMDLGSASEARITVSNSSEAQALQDVAAERCSMPYKAPELFNVLPHSIIDERTDIWSLGCILYALCFFKSPFDAVYERGDSVALAVLSGNVFFSESQLYGNEMENLIKYMLQVKVEDRPFISSVIDRTRSALEKTRRLSDSVVA